MSQIETCPTCGAKCKRRRDNVRGQALKAVQDKDLLNKIKQLKLALAQAQQNEQALRQELAELATDF